MTLEGKTILIIGGATGIGQATVELCAQRGATVIVADFNEKEGQATAAAAKGTFHQVNVTDEASVKAMFEGVTAAHGKIDALVQTAGILKGAYTPIEDFDINVYRQVVEVNTIGSFLCAKHATPLLKKSGAAGGKPVIVLISSGAAHSGSSSYAYGTSKGGVSSLGITMANKLGPEGIRVNVVCPGNITTAMKLSVIEQEALSKGQDPQEAIKEFGRTQGLGEPIGVAKLLAFLVSDDADYVRGSINTR